MDPAAVATNCCSPRSESDQNCASEKPGTTEAASVIHQIDGLDRGDFHEALSLGIVVGIATSVHGADETDLG